MTKTPQDSARDPEMRMTQASVGDAQDESDDEYLARKQREDPDSLLLSDYYANDLSSEQAREVEQRLLTDADFARRAEPFIMLRDAMRDQRDRGANTKRKPRPALGGTSTFLERRRRTLALQRTAILIAFGALCATIAALIVAPRGYHALVTETGPDTPKRVFITKTLQVDMAPNAALAYSGAPDTIARMAVHRVRLTGSASVMSQLPPGEKVTVITPEVRVEAATAVFAVRADKVCRTTVVVTFGDVEVTAVGAPAPVVVQPGKERTFECMPAEPVAADRPR